MLPSPCDNSGDVYEKFFQNPQKKRKKVPSLGSEKIATNREFHCMAVLPEGINIHWSDHDGDQN
jgi:hypothetical protein